MFLFDWIRSILAYFGFKRNAKLLIIGLDNAGKSTLLSRMSSGRLVQHPPTPQGRSEELDLGLLRLQAYDLGGHPQGKQFRYVTSTNFAKVRRVWRDYFPAVDGIIFMVDAADAERFEEARVELESLLKDELIPEVPIAVLFNKLDRKEAVGEEFLADSLKLGMYRTGKKHEPRSSLPGRPLEVFPCSVLKLVGYGEAMKWLAYYIEGN